jgi:hypothetical protein
MVSGPSCPVWFFDSSSSSSSTSSSGSNVMFDEKNPNYLLIKFLSRDVVEQTLAECKDNSLKEQYTDIRDQVCVSAAFICCCVLMFCSCLFFITTLMLLEKNANIPSRKKDFLVIFTLESLLQTKIVTGKVTNYELCCHTSAAMCRCCHAHFALQFIFSCTAFSRVVLLC